MSHFHVPVLRFVFCLFEGIFKQMTFLLFKDTRVLKAVVLSFKILRQRKIFCVAFFYCVAYWISFWNATNLGGYYNSYFAILQADIIYQLRQKAEGKPMPLALLEFRVVPLKLPKFCRVSPEVFCFQLLCNLYHHDRLLLLSLSNSCSMSSRKGFKGTCSHRFGCSSLRDYCPHLSTLDHSSAEGYHLWSRTGLVFTAVHIRACHLFLEPYNLAGTTTTDHLSKMQHN